MQPTKKQQVDMRALAQAEMDGKAKPPGSLGTLEDIAIKLSVLQNTLKPAIHDSLLIIFAADHGFTASTPGVSAYPREVSAAVFRSIASGDAASAVLCKANDCHLVLVDVGLDADIEFDDDTDVTEKNSHIGVITDAKVRKSTSCFLTGPAMTKAELEQAYREGRINLDSGLITGGDMGNPSKTVICIGELGIGNTTSAAALVCALTGHPPELVCGRGTGVDDAGLALKIKTVKAALEKNQDLIKTGDPNTILRAVGGFEIAAMVGAYIEAYMLGIPVIVDGFISGTAALVACTLNPKVERCLFWSHKSAEPGATLIMEAINKLIRSDNNDADDNTSFKGVIPILDMGLKLGEGTGAVLCVPLLRNAVAIMSNMAALKDIL